MKTVIFLFFYFCNLRLKYFACYSNDWVSFSSKVYVIQFKQKSLNYWEGRKVLQKKFVFKVLRFLNKEIPFDVIEFINKGLCSVQNIWII